MELTAVAESFHLAVFCRPPGLPADRAPGIRRGAGRGARDFPPDRALGPGADWPRGGRPEGGRRARHLTYANVAATLALVFAMSGGAIAAKRYLINSTGQINPKVLKKLKGKPVPGARGSAGRGGQEGPAGKAGTEGKAAPAPETTSVSAASVGFAPGAAAEEILKTELPTGTYTVLASTTGENNSPANDPVECVLLDQNDAFNGQKVTAGPKSSAYLPLPQVLYTVTAPSEELDLACKSEKTEEGAFVNSRLIATKIS